MSTLAIDGGKPTCTTSWPAWPQFDDTERRQLAEVLESGLWWFGEKVKQFEAEFARLHTAKCAVSCTNGTTAIEMALRGLGVVPGDEVIVPPYSFIATASAVVTVGAIPVFADIEPDTLCVDPKDVERKVTRRTRAIIPVHVAGRVADMEQLNAIAARHRVKLMEDAAHSWGTLWEGRGTGTLSSCGTFSFQVSKNITAGEGGVMVTNDEGLADLCRSFTHCGRRKGSAWYDHDYLGSNLRLTEFQAALLLAQLTRLEAQTLKRQANAEILDTELAPVPGLQLIRSDPRMNPRSYHMYIFRVDEAKLGCSRDRFIEALEAEGVPCSKGWYRPLYQNSLFQNAAKGPPHGIISPLAGTGVDYSQTRCPIAEQVCRDAVWIPQHVLLAEQADIRLVAEAVKKVAAGGASKSAGPWSG